MKKGGLLGSWMFTVITFIVVLLSITISVRADCGAVTSFTNGTYMGDGWYCGQHYIEGGTTWCNYWASKVGDIDQFQGTVCAYGSATTGTCLRSEHSIGLDSCTDLGTCADLATGIYCGSDPRVKGLSYVRYYCDVSQAKPLYGRPCAGQGTGSECISTGTGNDHCG